ncbi:MAG: sulfite oxidase [Acidobacteria bacterium]|nr:sulfite oxidase [Acidobacteriota bacterium]
MTCLAFPRFAGSQTRQEAGSRKAEISSFDLSLLDDWLNPNDLFFIRDHFPAPAQSSSQWKLSLAGAVANPFEVTYEELLQQPRKTLAVTLECAENPVGGGLVGNAEWTGVSLALLLEKARPLPAAGFVRLSGADRDSVGGACYVRTIPLSKALHADTLLVHRMNGEKLPDAHGFPLRAVVPGWYGMDSVKWLQKIELLTERGTDAVPEHSYLRRVQLPGTGQAATEPVTAMNVKAVFSRPLDGAILVGRRFVVRGAAWAGENRVERVEVSTDGGHAWQEALVNTPGQTGLQAYSWVFWEFDWKIPASGRHELVVRATDELGRTQPAIRPAGKLDAYEQTAYQRVQCTVLESV